MSAPIPQAEAGIAFAIQQINQHFERAGEAAKKPKLNLPENDEGMVKYVCGHVCHPNEGSGDGLCVNCAEERYQSIKGQVIRLPDGGLGKVIGREPNDCDLIIVEGYEERFNAWSLSLANATTPTPLIPNHARTASTR